MINVMIIHHRVEVDYDDHDIARARLFSGVREKYDAL